MYSAARTYICCEIKVKLAWAFFEAGNFYPDYVLWIDAPDVQYISFIDPKGLQMLKWNDPKIEFYATIKDLERRLQPSITEKSIILNSFIISGTRSEDLRQWWGKKQAPSVMLKTCCFCLDENDCIDVMISKILV